jgi:hypothetical protein
MAFRNAQQARIYIGMLPASAYARTVSIDWNVDMLDTTTLADTTKQFIPGEDTGTFTAAGPLDVDGSANGQFDALADQKGSTTPTPVTYLPLGTAGSVCWLVEVIESDLSGTSAMGATSDWSFSGQINGFTDVNGQILENNAAVTADTNGSAVDGAAATANGGVAHLHVTAFSGFTSDAITIEHSVDGSTSWATLATFTTVTGRTSERVVVAAGTTVRRYLRVVDNVTGTGSITRHVSFARR